MTKIVKPAHIDLGPANWITVTGPPPPRGGTLTVWAQGRMVELEVGASETRTDVARRLADALNATTKDAR